MHKDSASLFDLSIVVPLFNEQGNVERLIRQIQSELSSIDEAFEIILVDDGSQDQTWYRINELANENKNIIGIKLSRNFGHQHALLAGLRCSRGRAIISMDGDLQHPPALIPEMLAAWKQSYQIVNTCREDTEITPFFKRKASELFYKLFSIMTDVPMSSGSSDFRLLDRIVVESLMRFKDVDLFLRGAVNWLGFSTTTIPYQASRRFSGDPKYDIASMVRFAKGAIISFSTKPLIIGVWIGLITSCLAFVEIIFIFVHYAKGETFPGWASTTSILAFLFGILFVMLGIIGTYIARIHQALQGRPRFVLSETVNIDSLPLLEPKGHEAENETVSPLYQTTDVRTASSENRKVGSNR